MLTRIWQTVRRIASEILGVRGLKKGISPNEVAVNLVLPHTKKMKNTFYFSVKDYQHFF